MTLTATPTDDGASVSAVTLGGTAIADTDFTDGITVPSLVEGANVIVVTVTAEDGSTEQTYTVTVTRAGAGIPVTIEAEHDSIGGGVEDLKYTLTRTGATTDTLTVTVTLTQDDDWLKSTDLTHEVQFAAGEATKELKIGNDRFSFEPDTLGNLVATVTGTDVAGGTDTVTIISIADPPITIAFDKDAYTFPEGGPADEVDIYLTATLHAAFTRKPSSMFSVAITTEEGTATASEDYATFVGTTSFNPTDFTANPDGQLVASLLFGPSAGNRVTIVNDGIYEGDETFNVQVESYSGFRFGLTRVKKADGTFCTLGTPGCINVPYPVTITDDRDLPTLSLAATPASIAEEDDATTTGTVENVSTVTVEITNSKTFAVDQTVTLTLSGTATQGTHYSVSPGDADTNTADHQVVLVKETASVEVTVTATGNDTDDGSRTVTVAADLDGTAVGSTDITILDDDTTTAPTEPGAPTGLTATASGTSTIDLDWTEPSDDGDASITGYRIEVSPNGSSSSWSDLVANTNNNTTTYSHTGLSAGTTRHYRVSAINSVGTGAASRTANATTDAATTTAPAIVGVQVTSTPTTGDTYGLGETIEITVTFDNAVTVNTSGGTPRIRFVLDGGVNKWAEYSSGSGGTALVFTYTVLSGDMDADGIWLPENFLQLRSGTIRDATDNTVDAILTYAASDLQTEHKVDGSTEPGAPTGLTATASGTSTIDLDWTEPSDDGDASITGYRIEVSPNGSSSSWSDLVANTNNTTTTYSHTGLSAGTTRHYRVSAINSVGTGAASRTANATTDAAAPTEPGAPTGLTATASGTSTIDLDWTEPSDDGDASITGYKIEVSPNGSSSSWSDLVANTNNTTTTYSHTGLSAGTTRHYRVSAINSVGTGAASRTANATTDAAAPTEPGAPTGLTATASGTSTINLTWTEPSDDGDASITGYKIEVSPNGSSSSWSDLVANTNNNTTTYSHTGLSAGTTRHYRVSAINSVGIRRRLPHRQRHHRRRRPHRARRPDRPHGNGQRDQHDQPHLDRAVRRRRRLDHRLQDRGFAQWQLRLVQPRGQHQQHHHHLLPHRPFRRHHPPLPRLGHQLGRHRHRLPHRQRHHRHRHGAAGADRSSG